MIQNIPEVKLGLIAVSRGCFPMALAERRRTALHKACKTELYECPVTVENECDARKAVDDVLAHSVNALVVFLGNFGPETPETLLADWFDGPVMYVAAAEGDGDLHDGRGDAYCGLLNCSYNLGLRHRKAYIPELPVGTAAELADRVEDFLPIARAILGLKGLKVIAFGPRPDDFLACNAPIKVRSGRGRGGKLRAGSTGGLQQACRRSPHSRQNEGNGRRTGRPQSLRRYSAPSGPV